MLNRPMVMIAALAALSSCAPRPAPRAPTPPPSQPQARPPAPLPPPAPVQWEDSPLSAGDWTYRTDGASSAATFGAGSAASFTIRCEPGRRVALALSGAARSPLTIRTSYGDRSLAAEPGPGALVATLPSSDMLLDQIAFSRGRFAVEAQGSGRLILPAWPETARVIEDCRG
ncbi:MAG TPA: hypothetical protein VFO69_12965 [Allosphingosinicella sp.]|nr:hypothetical protein [Allosphingosinicella sp.]